MTRQYSLVSVIKISSAFHGDNREYDLIETLELVHHSSHKRMAFSQTYRMFRNASGCSKTSRFC